MFRASKIEKKLSIVRRPRAWAAMGIGVAALGATAELVRRRMQRPTTVDADWEVHAPLPAESFASGAYITGDTKAGSRSARGRRVALVMTESDLLSTQLSKGRRLAVAVKGDNEWRIGVLPEGTELPRAPRVGGYVLTGVSIVRPGDTYARIGTVTQDGTTGFQPLETQVGGELNVGQMGRGANRGIPLITPPPPMPRI